MKSWKKCKFCNKCPNTFAADCIKSIDGTNICESIFKSFYFKQDTCILILSISYNVPDFIAYLREYKQNFSMSTNKQYAYQFQHGRSKPYIK